MELCDLAPELVIMMLKELDPESLLRLCQVRQSLHTAPTKALTWTALLTGMGTRYRFGHGRPILEVPIGVGEIWDEGRTRQQRRSY